MFNKWNHRNPRRKQWDSLEEKAKTVNEDLSPLLSTQPHAVHPGGLVNSHPSRASAAL